METRLLKTIVVDDEHLSREVLLQCIRDYCPDLEVMAVCSSAKKAFQAIREHQPDLVFLDIEMPGGSGFDLLNMLDRIDFRVIFVTAYSSYAVQAFRYSAVDYLLKPVKVAELIEAVVKVKEVMTPLSRQIEILMENLRTPDENGKKLTISHAKGFDVFRASDIILCEADGYCTKFHIRGKTKISSTHILKHYEEILPKELFMRVHHSYIVNLNHVKGYTSQGQIFLSEEVTCPLSNLNKPVFIKRLKAPK